MENEKIAFFLMTVVMILGGCTPKVVVLLDLSDFSKSDFIPFSMNVRNCFSDSAIPITSR